MTLCSLLVLQAQEKIPRDSCQLISGGVFQKGALRPDIGSDIASHRDIDLGQFQVVINIQMRWQC